MIRVIFITLVFVWVPVASQAQTDNGVYLKGEYYQKPLIDFIHEMERDHHLRFSYIDETVKGVTVSGVFNFRTSFAEVLTVLLLPTPLSFYTDNEGAIVLYLDPKKKSSPTETQHLFKFHGRVSDGARNIPLPFVTIHIPALSKGAISDDQGFFEIKPIPRGTYQVSFSYIGYRTVTRTITINADTQVSIELEESPLELKEVVITPGALEISSLDVSPQVLGKEEILQSANFAKDVCRTLRTLPGVGNSDFSAKPRIRGGHSEETAIYLDNFQINEPFHLEEVDGTFSIFNTDYIERIKVLPGAFPARYADRLSGVIDMTSADYVDHDKYSFSIDILNASFLAQKKIADQSSVWVAARRGYLDLLINKFNTISETDHLRPVFYDIWTKLSLNDNSKHRFSFNVLAGHDNFELGEDELFLNDTKHNTNGWINWKWFPNKKFQSVTTAGYQRLYRKATFNLIDNTKTSNFDFRDTKSFIFTQRHYWDISPTQSLEAGVELNHFRSEYKYDEIRLNTFYSTPDNIIIDSVLLMSAFDGTMTSAYVQYNQRIADKWVLQPALRFSMQTFSEEANWAPRLAVLYEPVDDLRVSLGYGLYYQPDLYYKLRTSLGQSTPYSRNSKSIHYNGHIQYQKGKVTFEMNAYYKDYHTLYDDFRFEYFNRMGALSISDISFNTTSGYSRGIEASIRTSYGNGNTINVSYAHAVNKIRDAAGSKTYRDYDQPNTIIVNNLFRLSHNWNISLLWRYHSGYPYTPIDVAFVGDRSTDDLLIPFFSAGKKNSARLPDIHSLDIRFEKTWYIKKNTLLFYVNIVNLYNHNNIRNYWWDTYRNRSNGQVMTDYRDQINIPFFISPGLAFTIH